jgi:hypothetical protein
MKSKTSPTPDLTRPGLLSSALLVLGVISDDIVSYSDYPDYPVHR